jgi:hypothetical protein
LEVEGLVIAIHALPRLPLATGSCSSQQHKYGHVSRKNCDPGGSGEEFRCEKSVNGQRHWTLGKQPLLTQPSLKVVVCLIDLVLMRAMPVTGWYVFLCCYKGDKGGTNTGLNIGDSGAHKEGDIWTMIDSSTYSCNPHSDCYQHVLAESSSYLTHSRVGENKPAHWLHVKWSPGLLLCRSLV